MAKDCFCHCENLSALVKNVLTVGRPEFMVTISSKFVNRIFLPKKALVFGFFPRHAPEDVGELLMKISREMLCVLPLGLCLVPISSFAQSSIPTATTTASTTFTRPVSTGMPGQVDPAALAELKSHVAAVSVDRWTGFQGKGTITYGTTDPTGFNATLSVMGSRMYRLDATSEKGSTSVRIDTNIGKTQNVSGQISAMPLEAALTGLFPFELVRTFRKSNHAASLKDDGMTTIAGQSLHRITLERTTLGVNPVSRRPNSTAIDFYFDPQTHLLLYSVAVVPQPGSRNLKLLSVVSYGDYRKVGTELVPFRLSESIEGEVNCTLQLANVQLAPALDATFFTF